MTASRRPSGLKCSRSGGDTSTRPAAPRRRRAAGRSEASQTLNGFVRPGRDRRCRPPALKTSSLTAVWPWANSTTSTRGEVLDADPAAVVGGVQRTDRARREAATPRLWPAGRTRQLRTGRPVRTSRTVIRQDPRSATPRGSDPTGTSRLALLSVVGSASAARSAGEREPGQEGQFPAVGAERQRPVGPGHDSADANTRVRVARSHTFSSFWMAAATNRPSGE